MKLKFLTNRVSILYRIYSTRYSSVGRITDASHQEPQEIFFMARKKQFSLEIILSGAHLLQPVDQTNLARCLVLRKMLLENNYPFTWLLLGQDGKVELL